MSGPVQIVFYDEPSHPEPHPCLVGAHQWAWAYLRSGGTAQCCRRCGAER